MKPKRTMKAQDGIVLLEGLIAIVIFSFGVLAIVGMQASMVRASSDAKYRVDASFLVNQTLGLIWSDRANAPGYQKDVEISTLPNGKRSVVVVRDPGTRDTAVTVTVTWQMPGESTVHSHSGTTHING